MIYVVFLFAKITKNDKTRSNLKIYTKMLSKYIQDANKSFFFVFTISYMCSSKIIQSENFAKAKFLLQSLSSELSVLMSKISGNKAKGTYYGSIALEVTVEKLIYIYVMHKWSMVLHCTVSLFIALSLLHDKFIHNGCNE